MPNCQRTIGGYPVAQMSGDDFEMALDIVGDLVELFPGLLHCVSLAVIPRVFE